MSKDNNIPQKNVAKLPVDPGIAAWNALLDKRTPKAELEQDITADWLIIGAGFAGLSAAQRLKQLRNQDHVVMLEATEIATGPAGRNSGFMIDLPHELGADSYAASLDKDKLQIKLNRHALGFAEEASQEYGMPDEAFQKIGRINGAVNPNGEKHNAEYAAHLTHLGEAFTPLDATEMHRITGSSFYQSGLYMPGAALLQPALYIRSLGDGLRETWQKYFTLYENSPAIKFEKTAGCWKVHTPKGSVSAPKIILAVNGHAESFGFFKNRLMHVFTYASMTQALSKTQLHHLGGEQQWGITPSDPMGSTIRKISGIGGDRIVIRNRWSFEPSMEVPLAKIKRFGKDQDKSFLRRFPQLKDVEMEYRWSGRLCLSKNSSPAFGEIEEGLFSACCQNGLGTAKGTLSGIGAVDLAVSSNSEITHDLLSYPKPEKLPPPPLAKWGASAVIAWREFKAGTER